MSANNQARDATRRAAIITIAHVGDALDNASVRKLVAQWVAHGTLTDAQWELVTMLADRAMQRTS